MDREIHIASCVAYVKPESLDDATAAIVSRGLAEVPRLDPRGRLVVLIERTSTGQVMDAIDAIRALPGVLAVHLAYQHVENESEMEREA